MPNYNHVSVMHGTRCTIQMAGGHFCDAERGADMPFPICVPHALDVFRRLQEMLAEVEGSHHQHPEIYEAVVQGVADERWARGNSPGHQVYYVRVGELIKIGTTAALRQRLASYPPDSTLLATERGGEDVETERLHQFRHLLAGRNEWFRPGQDLLDHIATLSKVA